MLAAEFPGKKHGSEKVVEGKIYDREPELRRVGQEDRFKGAHGWIIKVDESRWVGYAETHAPEIPDVNTFQ